MHTCETQTHRAPDESLYASPSEAQKLENTQLLSRMREEPIKGLEGPDYVTGSNLPSHSDVQISCFTGLRIQVGLSLFLLSLSTPN